MSALKREMTTLWHLRPNGQLLTFLALSDHQTEIERAKGTTFTTENAPGLELVLPPNNDSSEPVSLWSEFVHSWRFFDSPRELHGTVAMLMRCHEDTWPVYELILRALWVESTKLTDTVDKPPGRYCWWCERCCACNQKGEAVLQTRQ